MSLRINTNIAAMNAWRQLATNNLSLQSALSKLSSGYRINRAADDAAGLAVSEKMKAQIRGISAALRNSQDAVSLIQTAEGAGGEIQNMVQRMRELAVQAGSDTLNDNDRAKLDKEFQELLKEIDRTASTVTYNGRKLINGESGDLAKITGGDEIKDARVTGSLKAAGSFSINVTQLALEEIWQDAATYDNAGSSATITWDTTKALDDASFNFQGDLTGSETLTFSANGKSTTIKFDDTDYDGSTQVKDLKVDQFISYVNSKLEGAGMDARLKFDSGRIKIESNYDGTKGNLVITEGSFAARVTFGFTKTQTSQDAAATITNNGTGTVLTAGTDYTVDGNTFKGVSGKDLQGVQFTAAKTGGTDATLDLSRNSLTFQVGANSGETIAASLANLTTTNLAINSLKITDKASADSAITRLDDAMTTISEKRAEMGALQNRLESTISNLQVQEEQLSTAHSRIRDVDMAREMAVFTRFQILVQASTAMLAQANQLPQAVLQLIR